MFVGSGAGNKNVDFIVNLTIDFVSNHTCHAHFYRSSDERHLQRGSDAGFLINECKQYDTNHATLGNLEPDDVLVAYALHHLSDRARQEGRPDQAADFLRHALSIREHSLGRDDVRVAFTLHQLGQCLREVDLGSERYPGCVSGVGRNEAEGLFRRVAVIRRARLGPDNPQLAVTLFEQGRCVLEAGGRAEEALELFRQALIITEARLGPTDHTMAVLLGWVARPFARQDDYSRRFCPVKELSGFERYCKGMTV